MRKHVPILAFYFVLIASTWLYAAWTTPRTWVSGEVVTAALLNTHLKDNLTELRAGGIAISSQAANDFIYATSSTQLGRVSGQLAFPSTQNASAGANTLDDYEEGTWTPVIGGSGGTSGQAYSGQTGTYTKVGRKVMALFDVTLSTEGTITTSAQIQGLPFTSSGAIACSIGYADTFTTNAPTAAMGSSATAATLYVSSATYAAITSANVTNTSRIVGVCHYNV